MENVKQLFGELVLAVKKSDFKLAACHLNTIVALKPDLFEDWLAINKLAMLAGEVELAKKCLMLFKRRANSNLGILIAYYTALVDVGEIKRAIEKAELLHKSNPNSPEISHFLSTVYLQMGKNEKAAEFAQSTLNIWPLSGEAWLILANAKGISVDSEIFQKMLSLEQQISVSNNYPSKGSYFSAISKIYEDHNDLKLAFDYAVKSNVINEGISKYDRELEKAKISNILKFAPINRGAGRIYSSNEQPIFIVGLPRSGTTLLEQILCSHSKIVDGGEFNGLERASRCLTNGQSLGETATHFNISTDEIEKIRISYLRFAQQRFGNNGIIVDKSLNNNRFVWLIKQVFPQSPIIFLQRNPLDTAWSCYKTHFSQGMPWSSRLENIAAFFNDEFELNGYWFEQFGNTILRINYEDLVKDTENEVRKIVDFSALEFEPEMLNFNQNGRVIFTASVTQVRKQVYSNSMNSYELEKFMLPFLQTLNINNR